MKPGSSYKMNRTSSSKSEKPLMFAKVSLYNNILVETHIETSSFLKLH